MPPPAPLAPGDGGGGEMEQQQQDRSYHGGENGARRAPHAIVTAAAAATAPTPQLPLPPPPTATAPTAAAHPPRHQAVVVDVAEDEPHPEGRVQQAALRMSAAAADDDASRSSEPPPSSSPGGAGGHPHCHPHRRLLPARLRAYFAKMRGQLDHPPAIPPLIDLLWSFIGAFCAILAVSGLDAALWGLPSPVRSYEGMGGAGAGAGAGAGGGPVATTTTTTTTTPQQQHPLGALPVLVASFGASAVLLFGVPESKLSQPRGCVGGHALSAAVGVLARLAFGPEYGARAPLYVVAALGMALALTVMQLTRTPHPPGGATALIACTAPGVVAGAGAWYGARFVLAVAVGSVIMTAVAVLVNNLAADRAYPTYWWWGTQGAPSWWCLVAAGSRRQRQKQQQTPAAAAGAAAKVPPFAPAPRAP
jgi:CBS domain-containing membrane protein